MNKTFWMIVAAVILATSLAVVKYGMRPQPIPIIKPSSFERPESVGEVIYKQTRQRLHEEPFLIAGLELSRGSHFEILRGVFNFAERDQTPYKKIILATEASLPPIAEELLKGIPIVRVAPTEPTFEKLLVEARDSNLKTVIIVDQNSALHGQDFVARIEKAIGHPVYALVMAETAIDKSEARSLPSPCALEDEFDRILSHNLGCYALRQTVVFSLSKRFKRDHFVASFEQMGTNEYVLYTHSP